MNTVKFEELNKGLEELGFKINGNEYVIDKVTYQNIIVNGQKYQKPEHHIFKMTFIGEGCEVDDSDENIEGNEFYEFVVGDENESMVLCIYDIEDFKSCVNI